MIDPAELNVALALAGRPLREYLEAGEVVYKAAGMTNTEIALALDKLFAVYSGRSALDVAGVDKAWFKESGK